ncbi:MAG: tricarballylate utilization protein [Pseudomonadota bacterium]
MTQAVIPILPQTPAVSEGARVMGICNSCRYCEGFCAVFPAMERRLTFTPESMHFLANLCHNCGACYHACQYAPPHAFALELPQAMAAIRKETYTEFAFPKALGSAYQRQGLALSMATVLGFFSIFTLAVLTLGAADRLTSAPGPGLFYEITPHSLLVSLFGPVFLFSLLAMAISGWRYWTVLKASAAELASPLEEAVQTAKDVLTMRYLHGGGDGCPDQSDAPSQSRRIHHHLVFYGFMLCLASTSVATLCHYLLNRPAPYPLLSLPVSLGTLGGLLMVLGCAGLLAMRSKRHAILKSKDQATMDVGFVVLLLLIALSGLLLLGVRTTAAMPLVHLFHLSTVLAFFLLMPYSKFVHGLYRGIALWWHNREQRNPTRLKISDA